MKKDTQSPRDEKASSYYDLHTGAVDDLVSAKPENTPRYAKAELEKYRSHHFKWRVPEGLKARSVQAQENGVSFLYQGEVGALIAALQGLPLTDLTVTEPELEEIFLHYYEKEGD